MRCVKAAGLSVFSFGEVCTIFARWLALKGCWRRGVPCLEGLPGSSALLRSSALVNLEPSGVQRSWNVDV